MKKNYQNFSIRFYLGIFEVELREAHTALDIAVDSLYRAKPFENDEERLSLLFKLYEALIGRQA